MKTDCKQIETETEKLRLELRRCIDLLDGECTRPDGSNADTTNAHALLGDFTSDESPNTVIMRQPETGKLHE